MRVFKLSARIDCVEEAIEKDAVCCGAFIRFWPIASFPQFGPCPQVVEADMTARTGSAEIDPEQTSAPCWISMSRLKYVRVRQPSGGSHYWNSGYVQTGGQFKQLGEGAKEVRVL